jgi:hypothetical protein
MNWEVQMTHTPGPWRLGINDKYHKQHYRVIETDNPNYLSVAEICWICNDEDRETEPNARLIAAAPEMLEALKKIEEFALMNEQDEVYEITKQAIAKATN